MNLDLHTKISQRDIRQTCLVLLIGSALSLLLQTAQAQPPNRQLAPPRPGLRAVPLPNLDQFAGMEASVQEQLQSVQRDAPQWLAEAASVTQLSEAYGLLGRIHQAYGFLPTAESCYQNAQQLTPKDFRWVYLLAHLAQTAGRADEAIQQFQSAQALRSDYLATAVQLGNLYLQQNRPDEAAAAYQQALALNPQCTAALYGLGQVSLSRRAYATAAKQFEQALAQAPEVSRINYTLALAYRGLGELDKARTALAKQGIVGVRVADPLLEGLQELVRGERLYLARGRMAFDAGRYDEAVAAYKKALRANPDSLPAHINLGSALTQLHEVAAAIAEFEAALQLQADHAVAHYNLGVLLAQQNHPGQAVPHLRAVLKQQPQDSAARLLLAQQLNKLQRPQEALAEFAQVAETQPDNEAVLLEWVKLLAQLRQEKLALQKLEQSHAKFPQRGQTAAALAYLWAAAQQRELRNGARALELAQRVYAATKQPNHGTLVALALAELGRCDEAATWQRKLLAEARAAGQPALLEKLALDLTGFENPNQCRPVKPLQ
jgi:tetratricopeptide (TPR) repeat protein